MSMDASTQTATTTSARAFGVHDWIAPAWPVAENVHAFVTTRHGGASLGPFASLDLGSSANASMGADDASAVAENRRRLAAHLPEMPRWLAQVHGNRVVELRRDDASGETPRADAAVTRAPEVVLGVLTADCLPVFFAAADGSAVGVAHAGWRGLAAGVLENTIDAMGVAPTALCAWLGPAIGPAAFEVGADVYEAFVGPDEGAVAHFRVTGPAKWHADLYGLARRRLSRAGVASIAGGGFCTYNDAERFYSYRRDRVTGRMAAVIFRR
jgi:polyphenol oxidase